MTPAEWPCEERTCHHNRALCQIESSWWAVEAGMDERYEIEKAAYEEFLTL